jgi:hypothetical protein
MEKWQNGKMAKWERPETGEIQENGESAKVKWERPETGEIQENGESAKVKWERPGNGEITENVNPKLRRRSSTVKEFLEVYNNNN